MRHAKMGLMEMHDSPDARFLSTNAKPRYAPDRKFKPIHVKLRVRIDLKKKKLEGTCTTDIELMEKTDEIYFDAAEMKIGNVFIGGKKASFTYDEKKEQIIIPLKNPGKRMSVEIQYSVTNPKLGLFFIHPTKDQPTKPTQLWTHSETGEARHWYPCQDQPETKNSIEFFVTVQKPNRVIANGNLNGIKDEKKGWHTYHWKMDAPNPSYLNAIMVGDFAEVKDKFGKTDVLYFCEKGREEEIKRAFGKTPAMMKLFSDFTGHTYSHQKYAQVAVADFIYGGMEHTTCTTQTDMYLQDKIAHDEYPFPGEMLAAHELAHQWFGDLLTCRDWSHGWLNESFATYFEALWTEHAHGKDEYRYEMWQNAQSYFGEDKTRYRRPIVTNQYVEPSDIFDRHLYEKGACILQSLRSWLGEDAFRETIRHYVQKHANGNVTTEDLILSIRETTGKNPTQFFDEFVYRGGHPELRIDSYYDKTKREAVMRVIQTHAGELYHFSVKIGITQSNGKIMHETKKIEEKEHVFTWKMPEPRNMVFDENVGILKVTTQTKPRHMWKYQLRHDPHVIHRIAGALELAKYASEGDLASLEATLENDPFWGVRNETALALGSTRLPHAIRILMGAFKKETDHRVKQSIVRALGDNPMSQEHDFLMKARTTPNSYLIPAEAYRALGKTRNMDQIKILEEGMTQQSWLDLVPCGAIDGMAALQSEEAFKKIISYGHPKYSNRIRQAVARNLAIIGKGREEALHTLMGMTKDPFINLQISAATALGDLGDSRAIPTLEELQKGYRDPRLVRTSLESIRKINGVLELPKKASNPEAKKKK